MDNTDNTAHMAVVTQALFMGDRSLNLKPFFEIRLLTTDIPNTKVPHISMWVPATDVDATARTLSHMINRNQTIGDEQEVWVMYMDRVKAVYLSGRRVKTLDLDAKHADENSKIFCSETHQWV